MQQHQQFELQFSFCSLLFFVFIHLGAIVVIAFLIMSLLIKILLIILVLISLIFVISFHVIRCLPFAIVKFKSQEKNIWVLQNKRGHIFEAVLRGNSICTVYFVLLNFKVSASKFFSVIIFPDSMGGDDFRKLRIQLRRH